MSVNRDSRSLIIFAETKSINDFIYRNCFIKVLLKKNYKIFFININSKIKKKEKKNFTNTVVINIKNKNQLNSFLKKKKETKCINFVEKRFRNLGFFLLLKKYNLNVCEIKRYGDIRDVKFFFDNNIFNNIKKIIFLFRNILNIIVFNFCYRMKIFNQTEKLFCSLKNNEKINSYEFNYFNQSIGSKFLIKFIGIFNFKFYKKIFPINVRFIEEMKDKKNIRGNKILFLDSNLTHSDRFFYEGEIGINEKKRYYYLLTKFFYEIQDVLKKKVEIAVHPTTNFNEIKKIFKNFRCEIYNTKDLIKNADILLFHESSSIIDGIIMNKKIISIKVKCMGKYYSFRNSLYDKELKCKNANLDRKININKLFNSKIKKNFNNFKKNHIFVTRKNKSINDLLDLM